MPSSGTPPRKCIRVLAVPVYRSTWLLHAWSKADPGEQELDWRLEDTLAGKLATACKAAGAKMSKDMQQQWIALQTAKQGSFRHWLYKLGQTVLSREDPTETFLKNVPSDTTRLELLYPASWDELSVRRHMRLLALQRSAIHRRKILGWGLFTLPQLPLILTPLPNVTLYFAMYRLMSHYQALQGATTLRTALEREDALRLQQLHKLLLAAQAHTSQRRRWRWWGGGGKLNPPAAQQEEWRRQLEQGEHSNKGPVALFEPSPLLETITQPQQRWITPLPKQAVVELGEVFDTIGLKDLYARSDNRGFRK